jgi:TubC N-terminal docking domain
MGALDVLAQLSALGVRLKREGDSIRAIPSSALTDEARSRIRAHKVELLELIEEPATGTRLMPDSTAVVRLRLVFKGEDERYTEAVLTVPREHYDGLRVFELYERHLAERTTRIVRIEPFDG